MSKSTQSQGDVPGRAGDGPGGLSHIDASGAARMVDVGGKAPGRRTARASGLVRMLPSTLDLVRGGGAAKGDVLGTARIAGIQAAKDTSRLIPLCHPLPLDRISVDFLLEAPDTLRVEAEASATARTGVEMEALMAVAIACLTVYDMLKAVDRAMTIGEIRLEEKTGGKSDFRRV